MWWVLGVLAVVWLVIRLREEWERMQRIVDEFEAQQGSIPDCGENSRGDRRRSSYSRTVLRRACERRPAPAKL